MTYGNILIVEDERRAADRLQDIIRGGVYPFEPVIEWVDTYEKAQAAFARRKFDLVFCDLLLLPPGMRIEDGRVVDANSSTRSRAKPRPFCNSDWTNFVLVRGGIGLIRELRRGRRKYKTEKDVLTIVTSYFDAYPGYQRTVRPLQAYKNIMFMPKFYGSPVFRDISRHEQVSQDSKDFLRYLLSDELENAEAVLASLRRRLFDARMARLNAEMLRHSKDGNKGLIDKYLVLTHNFELVVEFDPRGDPEVDWDVAAGSVEYKFDRLYENWRELRNEVLLNPQINVRVSLLARNAATGVGDLRIPLLSFSSYPGNRQPVEAHRLRSMLRLRCLLTYLAAVAEPPQGLVDYGWSVAPVDLQVGAMEGFAEARHIRGSGSEIEWPGCKEALSLKEFEPWEEGDGALRDSMKKIRVLLNADIAAAFKESGGDPPFSADHVVVTPSELSTASKLVGYFFNGDLRLGLLEDNQAVQATLPKPRNEAARRGRIFHWAITSEQRFACLSGEILNAQQLGNRLGMVFDTVISVPGPDLVDVRKGDVLLCAPLDESGLRWWVDNCASAEIKRLLENEVRIILAPDGAASSALPADVFVNLAANRVHCIYTPTLGPMIPEAKIIDAIICTGARIKYQFNQETSDRSMKMWNNATDNCLRPFRDLYRTLEQREILGDPNAGSCSIRQDGGICIITASRSDKRGLTKGDLAYVESYSPNFEAVRWAGERAPSSCTPWHAYIYRMMPNVKAIVHTHNKPVTYSENLGTMRTDAYFWDAVWQTGVDIVKKLEKSAGAVVLRGHGEVSIGNNLPECTDALERLRKLAENW
jgi:CheY-like chemotaxis protein